MITLYDDQQEVVDETVEKMRGGCKSLLIQAATGFGKSILAAHIIHRAVIKGSRVGFAVPRKDLLSQMARTFRAFNLSPSYIASGLPYDPMSQVHIASTMTLRNRLSNVDHHLDILFVDETHYGAGALDEIIKHYKAKGTYIIGLSATPWRLNGKGLGCWYDDMVEGPSIEWLIKNKRLSDYRAFAPSSPDLSGLKVAAGDYAKGQLSEKMEQDRVLIGDAVSHYKNHAHGKLGVTFAVSRKHSEMLAQAYRDAGIPAMHVDGETPDKKKREIFKACARREIMQLCNAELLTFGFDIASASGHKDVTVQCITDCQPTKSLSKQMQKWGRGLRYDPEPHLFFDHASNFKEHGLICDEREWTLKDRITSDRLVNGERVLPVRECPKCYTCHKPADMCPKCGHKYETKFRTVEEIEGELEEIERQQQEQKRQARMQVGMAKTIADLKQIAEERGYAPGWVFQMAKVKGIKR